MDWSRTHLLASSKNHWSRPSLSHCPVRESPHPPSSSTPREAGNHRRWETSLAWWKLRRASRGYPSMSETGFVTSYGDVDGDSIPSPSSMEKNHWMWMQMTFLIYWRSSYENSHTISPWDTTGCPCNWIKLRQFYTPFFSQCWGPFRIEALTFHWGMAYSFLDKYTYDMGLKKYPIRMVLWFPWENPHRSIAGWWELGEKPHDESETPRTRSGGPVPSRQLVPIRMGCAAMLGPRIEKNCPSTEICCFHWNYVKIDYIKYIHNIGIYRGYGD